MCQKCIGGTTALPPNRAAVVFVLWSSSSVKASLVNTQKIICPYQSRELSWLTSISMCGCPVQISVWFRHESAVEWRRLVFGAILALVCGSAGALCPSSKIRWSCSALNRIQFTVQWMYRRLRQAIIWALLVHINPAPLLQAAYVFKGNWQKNLELTFFWWPICWQTIFFRTS